MWLGHAWPRLTTGETPPNPHTSSSSQFKQGALKQSHDPCSPVLVPRLPPEAIYSISIYIYVCLVTCCACCVCSRCGAVAILRSWSSIPYTSSTSTLPHPIPSPDTPTHTETQTHIISRGAAPTFTESYPFFPPCPSPPSPLSPLLASPSCVVSCARMSHAGASCLRKLSRASVPSSAPVPPPVVSPARAPAVLPLCVWSSRNTPRSL